MAQYGFQPNTTITSAFWWYKPAPTETGQNEVILEINSICHIESTSDHTKVWIHFAAATGSTIAQPFVLNGAAAVAFMASMESLFQ